jgi:hypothetical protein
MKHITPRRLDTIDSAAACLRLHAEAIARMQVDCETIGQNVREGEDQMILAGQSLDAALYQINSALEEMDAALGEEEVAAMNGERRAYFAGRV